MYNFKTLHMNPCNFNLFSKCPKPTIEYLNDKIDTIETKLNNIYPTVINYVENFLVSDSLPEASAFSPAFCVIVNDNNTKGYCKTNVPSLFLAYNNKITPIISNQGLINILEQNPDIKYVKIGKKPTADLGSYTWYENFYDADKNPISVMIAGSIFNDEEEALLNSLGISISGNSSDYIEVNQPNYYYVNVF